MGQETDTCKAIGWDTIDGQTVIFSFEPRLTDANRKSLFTALSVIDTDHWTAERVREVVERFGAERGFAVRSRTEPR